MGDEIKKKIAELEAKLRDLKNRLPSERDKYTGLHVHADPINMMIEIEEIEEEIERLQSQLKNESID